MKKLMMVFVVLCIAALSYAENPKVFYGLGAGYDFNSQVFSASLDAEWGLFDKVGLYVSPFYIYKKGEQTLNYAVPTGTETFHTEDLINFGASICATYDVIDLLTIKLGFVITPHLNKQVITDYNVSSVMIGSPQESNSMTIYTPLTYGIDFNFTPGKLSVTYSDTRGLVLSYMQKF